MRKSWIIALSLAFAAARPATAQDAGRLGITFQVPASLGFIWHATEKLALRPEFTLATTSSPNGGSSTDDLMWGVAISAPYYLSNQDNVRTYLSPRVSYARSTFDYVAGSVTASSTQSQLSFSGSFGAQYAPIKRFNVFGETGYGYTRYSNSNSIGSVGPGTPTSTGLRSSVGVVLYFGP